MSGSCRTHASAFTSDNGGITRDQEHLLSGIGDSDHQVSTCTMGVDSGAVVDPELRVHGIDGLRVADASIMPMVTSGNTNAPSIPIGERATDFVLAT